MASEQQPPHNTNVTTLTMDDAPVEIMHQVLASFTTLIVDEYRSETDVIDGVHRTECFGSNLAKALSGISTLVDLDVNVQHMHVSDGGVATKIPVLRGSHGRGVALGVNTGRGG